jgi:hypothetical protein
MLFFTDRTAPSGSVNNLQGGGSLSFTGAMYFKTQKVKWSGGSTAEGPWTMIIADRLEFSGGNTNLGNDYTGPVKVPTRAPALVE